MKKEAVERIIFDNYDNDGSQLEDARQNLFELFGEENGWETADDIPDQEIFDEVYFQQQEWWDQEAENLKEFIRENGPMLVVGSLGLWYGNCRGGKLCEDFRDLSGVWEDCDYIKIWDENGHLYIECSHHDGTNSFECKLLTEKGQQYAMDHKWDMDDPELHARLWNDSHYTVLPHYAHKVWGCKKIQYKEAA